MLDNAKSFSDTAVVVIERLAGESNDATKQQYKRTEKGGNIVIDDTRTMLELTTEEEDLLNYVGANYAHVVGAHQLHQRHGAGPDRDDPRH